MTDDYGYWRSLLAGEKPQMNESNPQSGFYRWPTKASYGSRRTFRAVAYWHQDGEVKCCIDSNDTTPQHGGDIWVSVGSHAVSYEEYQTYLETGKWADEHELVSMSSNNPPDDDSYEWLKDRIADLGREANQLIIEGKVATTQNEADQISNLADRLAELGKKAEDQRKKEKISLDNEIEKIQQKWKPIVIASEVYKSLKSRLLTPFLAAQEKLARHAREEALSTGEPMPEPARARAGTRGRAMSLRSTKSARIVDRDKVLEFFRNNELVSTSLQILSDRAVRAGTVVPGTDVIEEQKVV